MPGPLNEFIAAVHPDLAAWSLASVVSSTLLVVAYTLFPDVRRTPGWQFLYSSLCEIYVAVGFLVVSLAPEGLDGLPDVERLLCADYRTLLVSVLAFDAAANNWRLLMYVDLIVVYHNPFRPNTARPLYHLLVTLAALGWATTVSQSGVLCTADATAPADTGGGESVNLSTLTWGLVYAPFLLFVLLGSGLYLAVNALLSRDRSKKPISRLARQRVMHHCLLYLLLYGLLLGLLAAGYANYQLLRRTGAVGESVFAHVTAALTAGRPAFGLLGWSLINRLPQRLFRSLCCCAAEPDAPSSGRISSLQQPLLPMRDGRPSENEPLGKTWLARRPRRPVDRASSPLHNRDRVESDNHGPDSWLAMSQGVREAGFKEELRYELVSDVAKGIHELAEREAREQHAKEQPSLRNPCVAALLSEARGAGVAAAAGSPGLTDVQDLGSPLRGQAGEGSVAVPPTRVQHYAVAHFRDIRASFNISVDFAQAFTRRSVSEGASGSFFYWVKLRDGTDTGYIVKQITKREKNNLMAILPYYKAYVKERGGRSLLQYLSCHSMRLRWQWSGKVYFVVMRNFFPAAPQLSFDLKGATANRRALKTWELHATAAAGAGRYGTLRDWEWMDTGMTTDLKDEDKAQLWRMVQADCDFLQKPSRGQNLLDYSLLLGIYRPTDSTLDPASKETFLQDLARQCRGCAFVSHDRQKVYFFGIIDVPPRVLEKFNLRWRVVLRLLYGLVMRWGSSDGISAMPPPLYADRFRTFIAHEVLHVEEPLLDEPPDERWREGSWCARCKLWLGVGPPPS